jgi:apolipoprotein N-acyltransferase
VSRRRVLLLVALGGLALVASYPPFKLPFLSFLAVTPAVLLVREAAAAGDARRAFRWGFWYGIVANGLVLYWLVVALWHFTALAALGYVATILILAALQGGMFWLTVRARVRFPRVPLVLLFPVFWTAMEWSIGHLGDIAFPWLGLGTSLTDARVLVQWADLAGARGITFWLAWCNVAIVQAFLGKGEEGRGRGTALARGLWPVFASIVLALAYGLWRERTLSLRDVGTIGLVQPNEGFREKWEPAHADSVMAKALALTRRLVAESKPDLIVWPESAVPGYLVQQPRWDEAISGFVRETHTPLVTGAVHVEFAADRAYTTFNAAFYYDTSGNWRRWPVYEKHYLVPVVERVPFVPVAWFRKVPWLNRWSGGFGRGRDLPLYPSAVGRFGIIICYESIFPDMARGYRRAGADFLVNVTNDAWYGRTAGPYQHAAHVVMRAIETRMGIARAANSGITELVDPLGRAHLETRLETDTVVAGKLQTSDVIPLFVRLGDWVGLLVVLTTLGFGASLAYSAIHARQSAIP